MTRFLLLPLLLLAACTDKGASRITAPQVQCNATDVSGRLQRTGGGRAFAYTTEAGWRITIDSLTMRVSPPSGIAYYEFWASSRETISGKHIKDVFNGRRSLTLDGGTLLTIAADSIGTTSSRDGMLFVRWISIYDGTETHRITFSAGKPSVSRSCAVARFEETLEHDGEGGRLTEAQGGLRFENTYTQPADASGVPLAKVPALVPLAQTVYSTPNLVNDFFDDPRLNAT